MVRLLHADRTEIRTKMETEMNWLKLAKFFL